MEGAGVSFTLMVDNEMSGRILDPDGNPMKGVCVYLEHAWIRADRDFAIGGCSKDGGQFVLKNMPPGQYRLVVNRSGKPTGSSPFSTIYYPGTTNKEKATMVTIGEGEHLDQLDIRVPALSRRIRIAGRMQFSDGTPIPGQFVRFVATGHLESATTASDGSFHLTVLAGVSGEVRGEILVDRASVAKCPQFRAELSPSGIGAFLSPPPISVTGTTDQTDVLLTFPFPSCSEWRNYGAELSGAK